MWNLRWTRITWYATPWFSNYNSRTKNQNSRIWIDWCKNITFQLPIAKVIGASTTLNFLLTTSKVESIYRLSCLGGTFFSVILGVKFIFLRKARKYSKTLEKAITKKLEYEILIGRNFNKVKSLLAAYIAACISRCSFTRWFQKHINKIMLIIIMTYLFDSKSTWFDYNSTWICIWIVYTFWR